MMRSRLPELVYSIKVLLLCVVGIGAGRLCIASEPEFSDVFTAGRDGYKSIRIPSVVVTRKGTVLAFAEGRATASDQAHNKIVLKRSTDGGKSWSDLKVVADDGVNSLNNPTAVVEQHTGRVFLMYQRIPGNIHEGSKDIQTGYDGDKVYRSFLTSSDDDGVTWSHPVEVTHGTKHPEGATTIASGPGIGIQLTRGTHAGRLVIPFNEGPFWQWQNYAAYSDDRGATWHFGENAPGALVPDAKQGHRSQINEVQMVELCDGSVRLNSRQFAGARVRKTAISKDGGVTWSQIEDVPALRDPSCMASIFRYSFDGGEGHGQILYSGPDSGKRDNGTVHLSLDDGATWTAQRVFWPGSFAYSVLTKLADGTVGCLFETDGANRVVFARFPVGWITETK